MQYKAVLRILGIFLMLHSLALIPPLAISLYYHDGQLFDFLDTLMIAFGSGCLLWLVFRHAQQDLRRHQGFLVVAAFWLLLSAISSLPFIIGPHLGFIDAFFEATSAFTTTGATVMTGLDTLPKSVLFYRQELQWFGGMGIIVVAIAIMPLLGIGGMQLYRAETPGPFKDEKLTPRIANTASSFVLIYLGMTLLCMLSYFMAGMSIFDAVTHSFATVSTGGFSTHDASIGHFTNLPIEIITELFMYLGALNFSIHFLAIHKRDMSHYLHNPEIKLFTSIIVAVILLTSIVLTAQHTYPTYLASLRHATFQTISVITSTGYITESFSNWPIFLPVLLIFISFIGGCSGSTAGGMKVIRHMLLFKQGYRQVMGLIHPTLIRPIKLAGRVVPDSVTDSVWGFFSLYVAIFAFVMILLMLGGVDQVTAFSAVAATLNNLGPGLGSVSNDFISIPGWEKLVLILCMLLGRLEIFTLLILFTPSFWRR